MDDSGMTKGAYAVAYVSTAIVFLAMDSVWLLSLGQKLYKDQLGDLFLADFRIVPAALFYLIYFGGILVFATSAAARTGLWTTALWKGAMLGFVCYATYDLTNQATLARWSSLITVADLCWGTVVTGVAAAAGFRITQAISRA